VSCRTAALDQAHSTRIVIDLDWNKFIGRLLSETSDFDFEKQLSSQKQLLGCLDIEHCILYLQTAKPLITYYVKLWLL
jgi:hypothetical protein